MSQRERGPVGGGTPPACALIVLDGLGDRPHPDTGGRSPVEAAATPHLDRLCALGRLGQVQLLGPGIAPESDAGVLALLGYDPAADSPGRGVLEAEGVGISLEPGDVALRLNFATSDGTDAILDSRVGRSLTTSESTQLARALTEADLLAPAGIRAEVRATVGHRGVLWLHPVSGDPLSPEISNADPFYERVGGLGKARVVEQPRLLPVRPLDGSAAAARTARAVDEFLAGARAVLAGHPINGSRAMRGRKIANALLVRNAGARGGRRVPTFGERYGLAGAAVTEMPVERGIARWLGFTDVFVGPMSADVDASLVERAKVTRGALARFPFVYVHLKGPDEPGHDGNARRKAEIVEALDRSFFGPFLTGLDLARVRLAITADHATPCIVRGHSDDPVPLVLVGAGIPPTTPPTGVAPKFGETSAAQGMIGTLRGRDVLPLLLGRPPGT
jgi:2,3-bisphosphoglycerate-independent phosphoglycerate mutase